MTALSNQRECGTRSSGGAYIDVAKSPDGDPFEHFLFCPPMVVNCADFKIKPIGQSLIQDPSGIYNVIDQVGIQYYADLARFLEEGRNIVITRKLSPNIDVPTFTPWQSRF